MISIASLIYRSTQYADAVWRSLHENTPELRDGRAHFFFVANDPTEALLRHLDAKKYPYVVQKNLIFSDDELRAIGYEPPEYIRRVYQGWNRAILESDEQAVLVSSDMMFASDWLKALSARWNPKKILASKLVERSHPRHGVFAQALHRDFGAHPSSFRDEDFQQFAREQFLTQETPGGSYGPLMFSKSAAISAGMYPEGNSREGYGDQVFIRRMEARGVTHATACDSIVYHFKEGEMDEVLEEAA